MSSPMKSKSSSWIMHVKKFASDNNLKYNEALKNPKLREGYVSTAKPKKEREFVMGKGTVDCVEHSGKQNSLEIKPKKPKKSNEPMVERQPSPSDLVMTSKKVGAKRQTLGKGRDLTQPTNPVILDDTGTLIPVMGPVKKGRPKKNKDE